MACFTVPAAEAVITTIVKRHIDKEAVESDGIRKKNTFIKRLGWLNKMLWGGSALLAFEHIWHGELMPWFPFLSNAANPADAAEMLFEMATSGVGMAVLVTAVWAVMAAVAGAIEKRDALPEAAESRGR